ncbi:MAG: hypothetical protein Ct9H300mP30_0120 [Methanobacteriota archaeon]|nr:MAG: hypothetical protein Ct9H300mP30_0120 [Euryarchaeota archaeon]
MVDPYDIILMPWITEKTLEARRVSDEESGYRENNNRIEFIVRREATKKEIREAVEQMFDVKVAKVNTESQSPASTPVFVLPTVTTQRRPRSS